MSLENGSVKMHDIEAEDLMNLWDMEDLVAFCEQKVTPDSLDECLNDLSLFEDRAHLCSFLDIGESTLSGWIKSNKIPRMAKISIVFAFAHKALGDEIVDLKKEINSVHVLKDGDNYQLCEFEKTDGVLTGRVIATGVPDLNTARLLASANRARPALLDAAVLIRELGIDNRELEGRKRRWAAEVRRAIEGAFEAGANIDPPPESNT